MSKFTVKAEVLQRFTALYKSLDPTAPEDLKCFRLEIKDHRMIMVGCNQYVACAEIVGETDQSDDVCYIKINNAMLESIKEELNINGFFTFETLPEIAMGTITDSDGKTYNDFIVWPDRHVLDDWRKWFILDAEENKGFMYCTLYQVQTLFETSPTGEITFPKFVNADKPVIVRDINSGNWIGAFIPAYEGKKTVKSAELPEWL